ncbi:MAG: hypothetical protein J3K34DRAFT_518182 [Monoraphidium minutum]|nr:MAG: hypothetical protein J3K34DRAFT_518182 [Monoraphidium minutum]
MGIECSGRGGGGSRAAPAGGRGAKRGGATVAPPPPPRDAQPAAGGEAAAPGAPLRVAATATRTSQVARQGACYGCGAPLQTQIASGPGYVRADKYEVKARHKQLNQVLCERCSGLCNGAMIPAVEDFTQKQALAAEARKLQQLLERQQEEGGSGGGAGGGESDAEGAAAVVGGEGAPQQLLGKLLVSPEELREKLLEVRARKAVVVLLVDLLDASGTLMAKVRDMVGSNPIVLVGTKMDLLPDGASPKEVVQWLLDAAAAKRLNVASAHLVSSHTGDGVDAATSKICRERKGRDVFVVGAANVGKSAFVRAVLREMSRFEGSNFDAAAMANSRYLPVESAMPGTTLGLIPLKAFESGGTLYDTPGVHLHHRIPHMLTPDELRLLHPRRRLRPFRPAAPLELSSDDGDDGAAASRGGAPGGGAKRPEAVGATYLWSGLARVDVLSAPPAAALTFYGPPPLRCAALPLLRDGESADVDFGGEGEGGEGANAAAAALDARASVEARGGLVPHDFTLRPPAPAGAAAGAAGAFGRGPIADLAVSGLPGWVSVSAPRARAPLRLRVWAPRGVEVFLRPPLPCGDRGGVSDGGDDLDLQGLATSDLGKLLGGSGGGDEDWSAVRGALDLGALGLEGEEEAVKQLLFGGGDEVGGGDDDDDAEGDWEWREDAVASAAAARRGGARPRRGAAAARRRQEEEEESDDDPDEAFDDDEDDDGDSGGEDPWSVPAADAGGWGEVGRGGGGGGGGGAVLSQGVSVLDALSGARRGAAAARRPASDDDEEDEGEGGAAGPGGFDPDLDAVGEGWVTLKGVELSEIEGGGGGGTCVARAARSPERRAAPAPIQPHEQRACQQEQPRPGPARRAFLGLAAAAAAALAVAPPAALADAPPPPPPPGLAPSSPVIPALTLPQYMDELAAAAPAAWDEIEANLEAGRFRQQSLQLVLPPFDTVRQAAFYSPWVLLRAGDEAGGAAAQEAYMRFKDATVAFDERLIAAAARAATNYDGDDGDVWAAYSALRGALDDFVGTVQGGGGTGGPR